MIDPDALLRGAIDLHAHGSPEFTPSMPGRLTNADWAAAAIQAGIRGIVVKSHVFPTTGLVSSLAPLFPDLELFSSITLNPPSGGLDPLAVEFAIEAGARVVWMPTWSARHEIPHRSIFLERMQPFIGTLDPMYWPASGLSIIDEAGRLRPEVEQIAGVCASRGVVIASGHIPIADSLVLCRRVRDLGGQFVLTHPLSSSVSATTEQQAAVAAMGGFIEHVFVGCMPMHQRMDPQQIADAVVAVGAEHCVMSTDAIETWNPPQPELLRMYIATMLSLGLSEDAVYAMTHDNPAAVLGLGGVSKQVDRGALAENRYGAT